MDPQEVSREDAASKVSAYVYGNILVLAALATVSPEQAETWHGVLLILGTGLATYIAHVFSEMIGFRIRLDDPPEKQTVKHEISLARPIATSATIPAIILALSALDWIDGKIALIAAIVVIGLRLAFIGSTVKRVADKDDSAKSFWAGIAFAAAAGAVALIKFFLTH